MVAIAAGDRWRLGTARPATPIGPRSGDRVTQFLLFIIIIRIMIEQELSIGRR